MDEFMNEETNGKKRSSKEKTAEMMKRKKEKKDIKKETRSTNGACGLKGISPEDSPTMEQKTGQD
jgi:hypothetical protein